MALDLGLTTRQLLSTLDDVALASRSHAQRLNYTLERGLNLSADAAAGLNNPAVGTGLPLCDNYPGGPVCARTQDGRPHRRPSAVEEPMAERRKPIVTELALADALDQLVNLIEELRVDVDLRVEITTDETELVKLVFSGTPDVGFPLQREVRNLPGQVVRRVWNEGLRDHETPYRSGDSV